MRSPRGRLAWGVAVGVGLALAATRCAAPTEIVVDVYSEAPCAKRPSVALFQAPSLEVLRTQGPASVTESCAEPPTRLGRVVLKPRDDKNASIAIQVATHVEGASPERCQVPGTRGCIIARRQLTFAEGTTTEVAVQLRLTCVDRGCDDRSTCVRGACVPALLPTRCIGARCDEEALVAAVETSTPTLVYDAGGATLDDLVTYRARGLLFAQTEATGSFALLADPIDAAPRRVHSSDAALRVAAPPVDDALYFTSASAGCSSDGGPPPATCLHVTGVAMLEAGTVYGVLARSDSTRVTGLGRGSVGGCSFADPVRTGLAQPAGAGLLLASDRGVWSVPLPGTVGQCDVAANAVLADTPAYGVAVAPAGHPVCASLLAGGVVCRTRPSGAVVPVVPSSVVARGITLVNEPAGAAGQWILYYAAPPGIWRVPLPP